MEVAHDWLPKVPKSQLARHTFSTYAKYNRLSKNICESFNQYIKESRDKLVLTMLENVRNQVICRFQEKREWIAKWKGQVCLRIYEK